MPAANLLKVTAGRRPDDRLSRPESGARLALCANAAGTMRLMMASMIPWAKFRTTYGERSRRASWCNAGVGQAGRPDRGVRRAGAVGRQPDRRRLSAARWSASSPRCFGSEAQKEAAIELLHEDARRAFVPARAPVRRQRPRVPCSLHLRRRRRNARHGASSSRWSAPGIQFFEPIGSALQAAKIKKPNLMNPAHVWALKGRDDSLRQVDGGPEAEVEAIAQAAQHAREPASSCRVRRGGSCSVRRRRSRGTMSMHQLLRPGPIASAACRSLSRLWLDAVTMLTTSPPASKQNDEVIRGAPTSSA